MDLKLVYYCTEMNVYIEITILFLVAVCLTLSATAPIPPTYVG